MPDTASTAEATWTPRYQTPAGIPPKRCRDCRAEGEWPGQPCPDCKAELEAAARERLHLIDDRLKLERLVAHRELQLARAQARHDGEYIAMRMRKLAAARRALERLDESVA